MGLKKTQVWLRCLTKSVGVTIPNLECLMYCENILSVFSFQLIILSDIIIIILKTVWPT